MMPPWTSAPSRSDWSDPFSGVKRSDVFSLFGLGEGFVDSMVAAATLDVSTTAITATARMSLFTSLLPLSQPSMYPKSPRNTSVQRRSGKSLSNAVYFAWRDASVW
jgi:hypothetical protein